MEKDEITNTTPSSSVPFPVGVYPTMITPFKKINNNYSTKFDSLSLTIDFLKVDALIEFYIKAGCVGIFSPCLSSEMFDLTSNERLALAEYIFKKVNGRVVLVSTGTYDGYTIKEQADFISKMSVFCNAVVVNTATLVKQEAKETEWKNAVVEILKLTGNVKLGLYECPVPYKRLLSPEVIKWCAETGRFYFHKDTSCSTSDMKAKINAIHEIQNTPFRFYNANVETLLDSLLDGGHGFSGISANFYPRLHVWLIENVVTNNIAGRRDKQQQLTHGDRVL